MIKDKNGNDVDENTACTKECYLRGRCFRYCKDKTSTNSTQPRADLFVTDGTGRCMNFLDMPSDIEAEEDETIFRDYSS